MNTHDFWNMGGFARYVWSAYGASVLVLLWNLLTPLLRRRSVLRELAEDDDGDET